ncbi:helix-turn-helix domain-containing protein [Clostridium kluyveri]|uniref:helix-turn-helix domain-containing protein n=1 Tax=Clostridium kluyveri TaxID=1534 RepID=UPI002246A70D|nr:helix-turn-helix transcriptional regulator [Clostridium kluyveri]UZQ49801.1 helix-turn-helix domain-containing protein [Clostridium kluyveri]
MNFGNILSDLRNKANITQQELANVLGISRGTIGMYEIGKRDPDTDTLLKIAKYFDVSIDYLLGHSDVRNPYIDIQNDSQEKTKNIKKDLETLDEKSQDRGKENESSEPKLATTEMVVDKLIKAGLLKDDKIDARIANMLLNSLKIDIELKLKEEEKKKGSS